MYKNRSQGFTLIELLVVIAIIGILSAVVLASLNSARSKGSDAAIQSDISTVQTQAEIYYGNNANKYNADAAHGLASATCAATASTLFADTTIANAVSGAITANGDTAANVSRCAVAYDGSSYAIAIKAKATTTTAWFCSDSSGISNKLVYVTPGLGGGGASGASIEAKCP